MELKKEIIVNAGLNETWNLLGVRFAEVYQWASSVSHSEGYGKGTNGATCSERGCDTTLGGLREKITHFDPEAHSLEYVVYDGLPAMFKEAVNYWDLQVVDENRTRVRSHVRFVKKGMIASLLQPVLKWQMSSFMDKILEEFKYYLETGKPHPRKVKAMKKAARQAGSYPTTA